MAIISNNGNPVSTTNPLPVTNTPSGTQTVSGSVSVSNFPATQPVSGTVSVASFPATQAVSAASLPLPAGAATSANQSSEITLLNTIATNTGASSVDFTATGTITAANGAVSITGQGVYSIVASVTGTWAGTLVVEGQLADTSWVQIPFAIVTTSLPYLHAFSTVANGTYLIMGGGYLNVRVRASAYTSGTVSVALDASFSQQATFAAQLGVWSTAPVDGQKNTYSAAAVSLVAATTSPTDCFVLFGSATKTVRLLRLAISAVQTTAATRDILLIKRSTADSAGTALPVAPHDSNSPAATAAVHSYTANPSTLGNTVAIMRAHKMFFGTGSTGPIDDIIWDFGVRPSMAPVLRGTAQCLAINLNGVAGAGNSLDINIEFTEE